ncbi:hypothetical protein CEE69_18010 [Rhodopirellula bahusiensis]|uniref:Uncharacterized protein n=1 Tax=Rhodopirellula bahusiensis TaxID=2014065 RepID=A0A2G1W460_9BACT|nr:hypothetical protein CEE69_18010 [Rhodopirellula bahusiensis]
MKFQSEHPRGKHVAVCTKHSKLAKLRSGTTILCASSHDGETPTLSAAFKRTFFENRSDCFDLSAIDTERDNSPPYRGVMKRPVWIR